MRTTCEDMAEKAAYEPLAGAAAVVEGHLVLSLACDLCSQFLCSAEVVENTWEEAVVAEEEDHRDEDIDGCTRSLRGRSLHGRSLCVLSGDRV